MLSRRIINQKPSRASVPAAVPAATTPADAEPSAAPDGEKPEPVTHFLLNKVRTANLDAMTDLMAFRKMWIRGEAYTWAEVAEFLRYRVYNVNGTEGI